MAFGLVALMPSPMSVLVLATVSGKNWVLVYVHKIVAPPSAALIARLVVGARIGSAQRPASAAQELRNKPTASPR